ncbi:penicillin acylase family protein [Kibdelosporangium phytohabitans]|uniref:penicillin acylase family protein n=1 Tax=Kibdelosporangium phytohabitans TaxID=860235 RepID=UPI0019FCA8F4|nr:penicillin acylase family protein [Kibdelosporangium phytohabitans]MBE1468421.1 acyl-homoserine-lactone acylase [Kibdelosporangium phytohabitans]
MSLSRRVITLAAAVAVAVPLVATPGSAEHRGFSAVVRYTENGVPHIKANDFPSLGFGFGYAAAKDNICQIADLYVTLSARRSEFFGPDKPGNSAVGSASTSLASDLYFQQVNDSRVVEETLRQRPPLGPRQEAREVIAGYVAGYNRFVRERRITDPACRDAKWVRPIAEIDVYRHLHALGTMSGQALVMDQITSAQPPAAPVTAPEIPRDAAARVTNALDATKDMGSNGFAFGRDATANGKGLLLGNPHFPWQGGRRFWQSQLTVPGKLDVSGASLLGLPFVQIGYTRDVAWTHTVATPRTFGLYQLRLVPGSPTTYLVDGKPEQMTSRKVTVRSRDADGKPVDVERTLWSTRYGPVVGPALGLPLNWTTTTAYAMRDGNWGNIRSVNTWFEMAQARDTRGIVKALSDTLGSPWVNTIATDRSGNATYADVQAVPNITDELARQCSTPLGAAVFPSTGLAVLDGANTSCAWGNDRDAVVPGLLGPSKQPVLTRPDYVANSNDSAWLTNPAAPITNYPRIVGDVATERGPRTRMAITELDGKRFSRQAIQDTLFTDRSLIGQIAAGDTAKMCDTLPDVADACAAIRQWDKSYSTWSKGALLFERFWMKVPQGSWKMPFNAADPVRTPNTLNTDSPAVRKAFTDAVAELRAAKIPMDAPLGQNQYVVRNGERIPVHGAPNNLGVLNMQVPIWDPAKGNTELAHGSSYIQAVSFDNDSCPDVRTLLTYSQSTDPTSPHFADQTKLFSRGEWARGRFCEHEILTSPALKIVYLFQR